MNWMSWISLAFNNGGIGVPKELTIKPGKKYFRFFSRKAFADYGNNGWFGNWWIDEDVFMALRVEASEAGESLTKLSRSTLGHSGKMVGYGDDRQGNAQDRAKGLVGQG